MNFYRDRPSIFDRIHFILILTLILLRTTGVLFSTAMINDASKQIVNTLRRVPTRYWSFEVERFIDQIEAVPVAFTGKNMFRLTRKVILAVSFEINRLLGFVHKCDIHQAVP